MTLRLFIYDNFILNVDSDEAAEKTLADPKCVRELTQEEIATTFGKYGNHAGPHNTTVNEDGTFTFDFKKPEYLEGLEISIRADRDVLIQKSDWRYLAGNEAFRTDAWDIYRQALRDITKQPGFPEEITWPKEPAS